MLQQARHLARNFTLAGAWLAAGLAPALALDPTGDWMVADGVATIRVAECKGNMWGAVVWEKVAGGRDKNNPDPAKANRPTIGMTILHEMKKKPGVDQWAGQVYNAKDGKFYESTIKISNPDRLEIQGCLLGFLCGGETWSRVAGPIPSSPSNPKAGPRSSQARMAEPTAAPPAAAKPVAPSTKSAAAAKGTGQPADPVGDICLLPEISRLAH